jgi:hypothetical protein
MYTSELPTYLLYYLSINLCLTGEKGTMRAAETKVKKFKAAPRPTYHSGTIV